MSKEVQKSAENRFAEKITELYTSIGGVETTLNNNQKMLIKKYFIGLDKAFKKAEVSRQNNRHSRNQPPIGWNSLNISFEDLASDMVTNVLAGLDPTMPNHVNFVPFFDQRTKRYNLAQILGYEGLQVRHYNQGLNPIKKLIVRLVREGEKFTPIYGNGIDDDTFEHIASDNPFEKSEVIGGYIYKVYDNGNTKLEVVPLEDILKRKPKNASAEFWGGEKDEWINGEKTGNKVKVSGWADEMYEKTLFRMAFAGEPLDRSKVFAQTAIVESGSEVENITEDADYTIVEEDNNVEIIDDTPTQIEEADVVEEEPKGVELPEAEQPKIKGFDEF